MYCCITAAVTCDSLFNDEQRVYESPDPTMGDIDLPIGTFLVCETGVTARLKEPFAHMSRHIHWPDVASSIAGLMLIALGERNFAWTMYGLLDEARYEMLESELQGARPEGERMCDHEDCKYGFRPNVHRLCDHASARFESHSRFTKSVVDLIEWAPKIAAKCPHQSAIHDLQNLGSWNVKQMDEYVTRSFLG